MRGEGQRGRGAAWLRCTLRRSLQRQMDRCLRMRNVECARESAWSSGRVSSALRGRTAGQRGGGEYAQAAARLLDHVSPLKPCGESEAEEFVDGHRAGPRRVQSSSEPGWFSSCAALGQSALRAIFCRRTDTHPMSSPRQSPQANRSLFCIRRPGPSASPRDSPRRFLPRRGSSSSPRRTRTAW